VGDTEELVDDVKILEIGGELEPDETGFVTIL